MKKFIILLCTILMLTACASTEHEESNTTNGNISTDVEEIENEVEVTEYLNNEDLYETSFSSYSQNFDVKQGEHEWRLMVPYLKGTAGVNAYYFDLETSGKLGIGELLGNKLPSFLLLSQNGSLRSSEINTN